MCSVTASFNNIRKTFVRGIFYVQTNNLSIMFTVIDVKKVNLYLSVKLYFSFLCVLVSANQYNSDK